MKEKFSDKLVRLITNNFGALVIVLILTIATAFASYGEVNAVWLTVIGGLCWSAVHTVFSAFASEKKINWKCRIIIYAIAIFIPLIGLIVFA